jgi:hypothetical protein
MSNRQPDKATRDAGMKKMMEDPRMDPSTPGNPPVAFDGKCMIFGGFEPRADRTRQRGWAHCRRYLNDALQALPKDRRRPEQLPAQFLRLIAQLG